LPFRIDFAEADLKMSFPVSVMMGMGLDAFLSHTICSDFCPFSMGSQAGWETINLMDDFLTSTLMAFENDLLAAREKVVC